MKKILIMTLIVACILGTAATALASGETIHHDYTTYYSYISSEYVPQKSDNLLNLEQAYKSPNAQVVAEAVVNSGGWQVVSTDSCVFAAPDTLYVPDTSSVRQVHVRIKNSGSDYGNTYVHTIGDWTLYH